MIAKGIESTKKSKADIARRIEALCDSFEVTVVTSSRTECRNMFRNARIIGIPQLSIPKRSAFFLLFCWFVLPFIRSDVVYLSEIYNAPAILTICGRRIVCYGNTHPMQHTIGASQYVGPWSSLIYRLYGLIIRFGLKRCDLILAISPQLTDAYIAWGIRKSRVKTLEVGVSLDDFSPPNNLPDENIRPFVAVHHGTLSLERGFDVILGAAKILSDNRRDFKIRLVGCDNSVANKISEATSRFGITDLFEVHPPIPHSEIPQMLWSSHCGISLLEPNVYFSASPPLKVLEYLAAGLPVIANDLPTHHLFLENNSNSMIIEYTAESLAEALERIMDDPSFRTRLSQNALIAASGHSDSRSISRLLEYISPI